MAQSRYLPILSGKRALQAPNLIQTAEVWGVIGLTLVAMLVNTAIATIIGARLTKELKVRNQQKYVVGCAFVFFILNASWGHFALEATRTTTKSPEIQDKEINVGSVQSNMGIFEKRQQPTEGHRRHLALSRELEAKGADLIVWPESGYFFPLRRGRTNLKARVSQDLSTPLIFGGVSFDRDKDGKNQKIWNTAYLIDGNGQVLGTYDKTYLLAFGEYIPFGDWFPFLYKLSPNTGSFTRGNHTKPLVHNNVKYGILICYEDILPNFVLDVMEEQPNILINITNDAWFGDTHEPIIHLALSTFRSVEHRRYLVRSTNTGISAVIAPTGEITHQTGTFTQETLLAAIYPLEIETLLLEIWKLAGLAPPFGAIWLCPATPFNQASNIRQHDEPWVSTLARTYRLANLLAYPHGTCCTLGKLLGSFDHSVCIT